MYYAHTQGGVPPWETTNLFNPIQMFDSLCVMIQFEISKINDIQTH